MCVVTLTTTHLFYQATILLGDTNPVLYIDRGFQYKSYNFKGKLDIAKVTHSMSRVGGCICNDPMEAFWVTLECNTIKENIGALRGRKRQLTNTFTSMTMNVHRID